MSREVWTWFFFCLPGALSRFCVHNVEGSCETNDLFGWCFHNKTSGKFDCDEAKFCAQQPQLVGKAKSTGCFKRGDHTVCCCNDNDGCNYSFIDMPPTTNYTQKCEFSNQLPDLENAQQFKDCDDPWCFALLATDEEGAQTIRRGCQSRALIKHFVFKKQNDLYNNNTRWQETQVHESQPRCGEIVGDMEPADNDTAAVSQCFDFFAQEKGHEVKGRLCCCRGADNCNRKLNWGSTAITMDEILKRREAKALVGESSFGSIPTSFTASLLSLILLIIPLGDRRKA